MTSAFEHRTRRFTVDEVLRMVDTGILQEGEPLELLDGELFMVPPQGPEHATGTTQFRDRLLRLYGDGYIVREDRPIVAGERSLPEPDVAVVRGRYADFARRHPRCNEALLVVEFAKTSLAVDRHKAGIYAAAGAPVYWLLDMNARRLEVHGEPHPDGRYGVVRVLAEEDFAELPERSERVRVADLLG
jgi:Uma2 family endonuclease